MPKSLEAESEARARVVAAARAWLGTPYHHAADLHGVGVDCAMILVRVFCDLGLVPPFDPRPYVRDWMLHRGEERYLGFLIERAREIDPSTGSGPLPGDVILFRIGRCYAHGGIVSKTDPLTIIHAFAPAGKVVEDEVRRVAELGERLGDARFFSLRGLDP